MKHLVLIMFCFVALINSGLVPSSFLANSNEFQYKGRGATIHSDATVQTVIPIPQKLATVVDIQIISGGDYCSIVQIEPIVNEERTFSISSNSPQIPSKWNVEIMSTSFDQRNSLMYVLLDNGTLIVTSSPISANEAIKQNAKIYNFEGIGSTDTWLIEKHELHFFSDELYVLKNERFIKISLHEEGYWRTSINVLKDSVLSVLLAESNLYILTLNELFLMEKDGTLKSTNIRGQKFIDASIVGETYFLLDEKVGLLVGKLLQPSLGKVYEIEKIQSAKQIRGRSDVLFIVYKFENRDYLAQYFIQDGELILNRYYHKQISLDISYYSIKDVHLTERFAIINAYNEFILLHHSINRNSFRSLAGVEYLYKSYGVKVVDIIIVPQNNHFSLLITFKERISLLSIANKINQKAAEQGINRLYVSCKSEKPLSFLTSIKYNGICSSATYSPQRHFCSAVISDSISFEYSHVRKIKEQNSNRFIFGLVFIILIAACILILLVVQRKLSKVYNKLKTKEENMRNQREQHSLNMEQTFNADILKTT